jgi:hypothetical protein
MKQFNALMVKALINVMIFYNKKTFSQKMAFSGLKTLLLFAKK